MTAKTPNDILQVSNNLTSQPLKVALAGITMIQQSLLEFYFATQEGAKKYTQVLGKDADVYITNFDENGAIEAWENLYAHENKPTLVLSNNHKEINNYIYISKPITPTSLVNAAISLKKLLHNDVTTTAASISLPLSDFVEVSPSIQYSNTITDNSVSTKTDEGLSLLAELEIPNELDLHTKNTLDELSTPSLEAIESNAIDKPSMSSQEKTVNFNSIEELTEELTISALDDIAEISTIEEPTIPTLDDIDKTNINTELAAATPLDTFSNELDLIIPTDKEEPTDDLQALLDEFTEDEESKKKEVLPATDKPNKGHSKKGITKQQQRWYTLCGEHENTDYEENSSSNISFKISNTLFPYLKDTIDFSKRNNCWMEVSYKYLSLIIDPETQRIYSTLSLKNKNFIYLCTKDMDEDQIELEEIDEQGISQLKQNTIEEKYFDYSFEYFLWVSSLIVSHGRLPDDVSPDDRISIKNWLSLKEVEKFPHIMQIAAVFNQHHASLNEVATWMNLPKRYVYAFYNGIAALDMIEHDNDKSNKKPLITMPTKERESTLKKILFTKIM
ncbi:MAG TPA: hypothetical protein EYG68_01855 [Leucothrix mucor]|nr:hypothetical protein [Leucothrix mucor]